MRIRKNASKLILGSATSTYDSTIESPPNLFAASSEAEEVICELNCSPWDVMLFDCSNSFDGSAEYFEEEDGGSLGNIIKTEMEPISSITSIAAELTLKEMKEMESQKAGKKTNPKKSSSSKGKERAAEETTNTQYCKKSDGKGWHCKRPALPHSRLCSYHLAQCRSYTSHPSHKPSVDSSPAAADHINGNGSSKNRKAREADANLYYYYGGFGPSRGKRRGGSTDLVSNTIDAKVEERVLENAVECIDEENVAGDDEYDVECFQHGGEEGNEIKEEEGGEKKKKVLKKRGRKPIKARSLKSLL